MKCSWLCQHYVDGNCDNGSRNCGSFMECFEEYDNDPDFMDIAKYKMEND